MNIYSKRCIGNGSIVSVMKPAILIPYPYNGDGLLKYSMLRHPERGVKLVNEIMTVMVVSCYRLHHLSIVIIINKKASFSLFPLEIIRAIHQAKMLQSSVAHVLTHIGIDGARASDIIIVEM